MGTSPLLLNNGLWFRKTTVSVEKCEVNILETRVYHVRGVNLHVHV